MNRVIQTIEKHAQNLLYVLIATSLILGIFYSLYLGDLFRFYDEGEYYTIAQNIVTKGFVTINGTDPSAWRPPGYPFWLSIFIKAGANLFLLRMINFVLNGLSLFLIYKILENRSKLTGLIGAVLFSLYPLFFFTASTLYPQTFVTTLFLLALYLLLSKKEISYKTAFIIGLIYGLLTLTVVTFLGSLIVTVIWLCLFVENSKKKALLMLMITLLTLMPWTIRNYLVFNTYVFVANNGGVAFVMGNSPDTRPNGGGNIKLPEINSRERNEIETDQYFKMNAWNYILTHKFDSLKMYILKFLNYFNYSNILMTHSQMSLLRERVLFITYYSLLGLALLRILLYRKIPLSNKDFYLITLYLGHGLLLALFITRIRYRLPYDAILVILGASFLGIFLQGRNDTTLPSSID